MTSGTKKLYFYRHDINETIVNTYDALEWDDFLIVRVGKVNEPVTQEMIDSVSDVIDQMDITKYTQIIIMPADIDIDFYGVDTNER